MSPRAGLDIGIILQTAGKLADEHGWEEVTLARLAKALGVRSPSLYNHVNGLPDLRHQLAVYALQMLKDQFTQAAEGRSAEEVIRALSAAYLNFARSHPGLYEAALRSPDPEQTLLVRISEEIVEMLTNAMAHFSFTETEAVHAVRGLRSLLHGFASLEQKGGFGLPLNLDETFSRLLDIYIAGLHSLSLRR